MARRQSYEEWKAEKAEWEEQRDVAERRAWESIEAKLDRDAAEEKGR